MGMSMPGWYDIAQLGTGVGFPATHALRQRVNRLTTSLYS